MLATNYLYDPDYMNSKSKDDLSEVIQLSTASVMPERNRWVSERNRVEGSRIRLFCLPHAGSGAAAFNSWKRIFPSLVEVCPILLPGRETRLDEASYSDCDLLIRDMTDALSNWFDKPYAIFGHSMGALLAFEMAQTVRSRGLREPRYLFLSGRIAPHLAQAQRPIHQLPHDELIAELEARYGGLPREILQDPEMLEIFLPILRTDLTLIETHCYRERPRLRCPIMVSAGVHDVTVSNESLAAWRIHTVERVEVHWFSGGHFYLTGDSRASLLEKIAEKMLAIDAATANQLQAI